MNLVDLAIAIAVTGLVGTATIPFIPALTSWMDNRTAARRAARAESAAVHPVNRPRTTSRAIRMATLDDHTPAGVWLALLWTELDPELQAALDEFDLLHLAPDSG